MFVLNGMWTRSTIIVVAIATLMAACPLRAGTTVSGNGVEASSKSWLAEWWNGKYAGGNWFGVRDTLEDYGLTLGGNWTGVFYGVVDGGKPNVRGGYFDEEIQFIGELNIAKLTGWEPLIQPNGTGAIENAAILGFETGLIF